MNGTKATQLVIDCLEGDPEVAGTEEELALKRLKTAHKFVFDADAIPFDLWTGAMKYGDQLWQHDRLRLPFPEVVFQVGPYEDEDDDGSYYQKFWYVLLAWEEQGSIRGRMYYRTIEDRCNTNRCTFTLPAGTTMMPWVRTDSLKYCTPDRNPLHGPSSLHDERPDPKDPPNRVRGVAKSFFALHLLAAIGCLNAGGIVSEDRPAPAKLNAQRLKKGKPAIFSYKFVTVDPTLLRMPGVRGTGTHASPCLHWRRGHKRTVAPGKEVWINAVLVGDPDRGFIQHDYRVETTGPFNPPPVPPVDPGDGVHP
jgi:hypothetical protein